MLLSCSAAHTSLAPANSSAAATAITLVIFISEVYLRFVDDVSSKSLGVRSKNPTRIPCKATLCFSIRYRIGSTSIFVFRLVSRIASPRRRSEPLFFLSALGRARKSIQVLGFPVREVALGLVVIVRNGNFHCLTIAESVNLQCFP